MLITLLNEQEGLASVSVVHIR